jgi:DNA polymerase III delta subunit
MLHLYYGTDTHTVRKKSLETAAELSGGIAEILRIDGDNYQVGMIGDALGATSLFAEEYIYIIDTPSAHEDLHIEVEQTLSEMQESDRVFIVVEESLLAAARKKYEKYARVTEEYKAEKAERFNAFAMADALAAKDKKKLWVQLQEAKHTGLVAEEIIGTLWWQLKSLRLANVTKSASEAGMKEYPYNKAKRSLGAFKTGEVDRLSRSLLELYHAGHTGVSDINQGLEQWVLRI